MNRFFHTKPQVCINILWFVGSCFQKLCLRIVLCGALGMALFGLPGAVAPHAQAAVTSSPLAFAAFPAPAQLMAFAAAPSATPGATTPSARKPASEPPPALSPLWLPLVQRLRADGLYAPEVEAALMALREGPSSAPMGRKIRELYKRAFMRPPPSPPPPPGTVKPRPLVYPNIITAENIRLCRQYLLAHKQAFDAAQARFHVPREIAVALLFVETRLGTFVGKESAFATLTSMAASRSPSHIADTLADLPDSATRLDWVQDLLIKRSDWAYKELAALINNLRGQNADFLAVPGSIYGAVGLCQFMPSNLVPYGIDGNNDGRVDLFVPADAIASLSNYLVKHGWKPQSNRKQRHKALKSYNRIDIYANTILELAAAIDRPAPKGKNLPKK